MDWESFATTQVVLKDGYEIVDEGFSVPARNVRKDVFLKIQPKNQRASWQQYNPFEKTTTFREFAALDAHLDTGNLNAILDFANKYGLLGFAHDSWLHPENLIDWAEEIYAMAIVVKLWNAISNHEMSIIKKHITFQDGQWSLKNYKGEWFNHPDSDEFSLQLAVASGSVMPANELEAANHFICQICNIRLMRKFSGTLYMDNRNIHPEFIINTHCLINVLWFNFTQAITRNLKFKQCEECTSYIQIRSKKRRFEKRFCSSRCQKRSKRKGKN